MRVLPGPSEGANQPQAGSAGGGRHHQVPEKQRPTAHSSGQAWHGQVQQAGQCPEHPGVPCLALSLLFWCAVCRESLHLIHCWIIYGDREKGTWASQVSSIGHHEKGKGKGSLGIRLCRLTRRARGHDRSEHPEGRLRPDQSGHWHLCGVCRGNGSRGTRPLPTCLVAFVAGAYIGCPGAPKHVRRFTMLNIVKHAYCSQVYHA